MSGYNQGTGQTAGDLPDFFTLDSNRGFVGINTAAPQYELDVVGTVGAARVLGVSYADVLNRPSLAAVATSGQYADLLGRPALAAVATTGSYTDLLNKPVIPAPQVNSDWAAASGVAQVLNKPAALSQFGANDLTTFASLSTPGALQAANSNVNHTLGNIASTQGGVAVYGSLAVQGTAGVNGLLLQNKLLHNQGGSSNLVEIVTAQGQVPYSVIVDAPATPDVNVLAQQVVNDLMLAINADPAALARLKALGIFPALAG